MNAFWKKTAKTFLSVSSLVVLILILSPLISKILDLVFSVAVKE